MHPLDPEMRRPATRQSDRAKIANSEQQKQSRSVSVETQACFFVLLPIVVTVVLLALAGVHR
jgi:hypothetical protein